MKLLFLKYLILCMSFSALAQNDISYPTKDSNILILEFSKAPNTFDLNSIKKIKNVLSINKMSPYRSPYFDRIYELHLKPGLSPKAIEKVKVDIISKGNVTKVSASFFAQMKIVTPKPSQIKGEAVTESLTSDTLFNLQWNLVNSGQRILVDIDDIRPEILKGKLGVDIGWTSFLNQVNSSLKNDIKVAVIDSGMTTDHPDLKNSFFRNTKECNSLGNTNVNATEDKDGNGYVGDCMGWSFATPNTFPNGKNIVDDDFGHGTHVAAIMSADIDNNEGIAGISKNLKIIPIKVYVNERVQPGAMTTTNGFIHNVAKGILYAVTMKADVINISLGWPQSADTDYVREAIQEALKNNITVVAAAGNDNHSSQVFPCAYKGVICVGSLNNDGTASDFSNYGGHVDTVAPGNQVLSVIPMKRRSEFSIPGYDIKSGTSQAAPHISAIAGILKSLYPHIKNDEIYARIILSGETLDSSKYFLGGLANILKSITIKPQPLIRPVFKEWGQTEYRLQGDNAHFELKIPIKNYWYPSKSIEIEVSTDNSEIVLLKNKTILPALTTSEIHTVNVQGFTRNLKTESHITLHVSIKTNGQAPSVFKHDIFLTRSTKNDPEIKNFPLIPKNFNLSVTSASNIKTVPQISFLSEKPEYYIVNQLQPENSKDSIVTYSVFRNNGYSYTEEAQLELNNIDSVLMFLKLDLNYDGQPDYLINYIKDNNGIPSYEFLYLDQNLKPLFGKSNSTFIVKEPVTALLRVKRPEENDESFESLRFVPFNFKNNQKMAVPVFISTGLIPPIDQNPDPFENINTERRRIYFAEPSSSDGLNYFTTRAWVNYDLIERLREVLKIELRDYLSINFLMPQTRSQFYSGTINILAAYTQNDAIHYFKINSENEKFFSRKFNVTPISGPFINLESHKMKPVWNLDKITSDQSDFTLDTLFTLSKSRITYLINNEIIPPVYTEPVNPKHQFPGRYFIRGYQKGGLLYSFMMTMDNLILSITGAGERKQFERIITKSWFLPTHLMGENIEAISIGEGKHKEPAIYFDASRINTNHVYIVKASETGLLAPLNSNIQVPENCITKNPIPWEQETYAFTFLCQDSKDSFSIKHGAIK